MTALAPHMIVECCRGCGGTDLATAMDFGTAPIADRLIRPGAIEPDLAAPLTLAHCPDCGLSQIRETVAPRYLFGADYPYFSSVSPALMAHFAASATAIVAAQDLGPDDLVVEAASNDGYMLQNFARRGIPVLGVDPADGPVAEARAKGIETIHGFFDAEQAKNLATQGRRARVFLANNVLAHVADVNDFIAGIAALLTEDGVAVIEAPYLFDLIDGCAFDTIYHQHLLYLAATPLVPLFARHGLHLNDVERLWVHGGSLRLFVSRRPGQSPRLTTLLATEAARDVHNPALFAPFVRRIEALRRDTRATLARCKAEGLRVAGYGAAAKATTLLHVFGLGRDDLDMIFDRSPWKRGRAMPGTRIPILSPDLIASVKPDVILLLAWNFADEIIAQNQAFLAAGGRFVVPIPELREVAHDTTWKVA